ncbi:carboxypeptidase M32 [Pontivivens insulae]|uniref:Metal-dependent carboxypeptidase n=1 Tax=Pontivivens insulae TaxID=1639689 RepID=A0A2R8A8C0_9RHOB|nr:carboxypeptidase M32 [Pontivivens insulae]RED18564.1 carboxypeptidase Taq [Pontivivens insulae]SPF28462.1 Thermostable carboxypeptidase 1 [Pontivivens insulae]
MSYAELIAFEKQTQALGQVSGLLGWDQEAIMPPKAGAQRAEQMGAMAAVLHARRTDPRIGDWLTSIDAAALNPAEAANIRRIRRDWLRNERMPADLAEELAKLTSVGHGIWAQARADEDVAAFLPTLTRMVARQREAADAQKLDDETRYDALLDGYEPGMRTGPLTDILGGLRAPLSELRARIAESGHQPRALEGQFDADGQMAVARELATVFGYDWQAGRMDLVTHPFCSGTLTDVRITTRVDPIRPFDCLYSVVHEVGHAVYEQGLPLEHALTPAGGHVSMGVHESQSRMLENQMGRSRAFCTFLHGKMVAQFGIDLDAEQFYAAVNRVGPGFIRTEADEVHYNLHVLMRFDLERALIMGELEVSDLEAAWNERFEADFGVAVPQPSKGVLQDVHWSAGLFGYFPTYSLGNIYAAALFARLRAAVPSIDSDLERGETTAALAWLRENVHQHGSILTAPNLMERATGGPVTSAPLVEYLNAKFGDLYGF